MSKKILIFILLVLILSLPTFVHSDDYCASNQDDMATKKVCCDSLCEDSSIYKANCTNVVYCYGATAIFASKYFVLHNNLEIKVNCSECSNQLTCNGENLEYYTSTVCSEEDCINNGTIPALPEGCVCGSDTINWGYYCCYENGKYTSSENVFASCQGNAVLDSYDISGTLTIDTTHLGFNLSNLVLGGITQDINYESYNINDNSVYEIINVSTGTYNIFFNAVDKNSDDQCIVCNSTSQYVEVDADIPDLDFVVICDLSTNATLCDETPPGPTYNQTLNCTVEGVCNPAINAICEYNVWEKYNLTIQTQYDDYCSPDKCRDYDSDCAVPTCFDDGMCNGICPDNCYSPDEDPDCGIGQCNLIDNKWCNKSLGSWMYYEDILDYYCLVCSQDTDVCAISGECGDGEIIGNEQCDYGNDDGEWQSGPQGDNECEFELCGPADSPAGCTCIVPTSECNDGTIEYPEDCEIGGNNNCANGYYCDQATCMCTISYQNCNFEPDSAIINVTLSSISCTDKLSARVSISPGCADKIQEVHLKDGGSGTDLSTLEITQDGQYYYADFTFENLAPDTVYSFKVGVLFEGSANIDWGTKIYDITTGSSECMGWFGRIGNYECLRKFCDNQNLASCLSNNIFESEPCNLDSNEVCIFVPDQEESQCLALEYADKCSACMGISSMFWIGANKMIYNPNGEEPIYCEDLFSIDASTGIQTCYRDSIYTTVDDPNSCMNVISCYDYHSESVCNLDPCSKTSDYETCEWNSYNVQTGRGVCVPSINKECSNALEFSSNNLFLYNLKLGNNELIASSKRICELYGDCYYRVYDGSNSNNVKCLDYTDLICDYLVSPENCIGQNNNIEFNIDPELLINQNYSINLISNKSKCKWDQEQTKCYRDANDDNREDERQSDDLFGFIKISKVKLNNNLGNQRDFIAPTTSIVYDEVPSENIFGTNVYIPFEVSDNLHTSEGITTYYCLSENVNLEQDEVYSPTSISDYCNFTMINNTNATIKDRWKEIRDRPFKINIDETNTYTIYFFSVDDSANIERIKAFDFTVFNQTPTINLNYSYDTYPAIPRYLNNLDVEFTVQSYGDANCEAYLYYYTPELKMIGISGSGNYVLNATGSNFFLEYPGLYDNTYYFNVTCVDLFLGNKKSLNKQIDLQGDTRIFNSTPRFKVFKDDEVLIQLKTHNDAECYYRRKNNIFDDFDYADMVGCVNTSQDELECGKFSVSPGDVYIHEKRLNFNNPNSGVYIYDVACMINTTNNEGAIVREEVNAIGPSSSDLIIFSQDYTAPLVDFKIKEDAFDPEFLEFNPSVYYREPNVSIKCVDPVFFDGGNFKVLGHELIFGCSENGVYYSNVGSSDSCSPNLRNSNPYYAKIIDPDKISGENNGGNTVKICYKAEDNASNPNIGNIVSWNVSVDNVKPSVRSFNITEQNSDQEVDVITKDFYEITMTSDEKLSEYNLSFELEGVPGEVILNSTYIGDSDTWITTLNVWNQPELWNQNTNLTFNILLMDKHGLTKEYINYGSIEVDTSGPPGAKFEPMFNDVHIHYNAVQDIMGNKYPVYYEIFNLNKNNTFYSLDPAYDIDDTFYSNTNSVSITGYTMVSSLIVNLLMYDQIKNINLNDPAEYFWDEIEAYNQADYNGIDEDNPSHLFMEVTTNEDITHSTQVNSSKIYLNDQYGNNTNFAGTYAKLPIANSHYDTVKSRGKRTTYGNYFKYYNIINSEVDDSINPALTYLILDTSVEANLLIDTNFSLYNQDLDGIPKDYFILNFDKDYEFACGLIYGTNAYKFKVRTTDSIGMINDSLVMKLFIDTNPPLLRRDINTPENTVKDTTPLINFEILEDSCGSGLFLKEIKDGNTNFKAKLLILDSNNITVKTIVLTDQNLVSVSNLEKANLISYKFEHQLTDSLIDGDYTIKLEIYDYAQNKVDDFDWPLTIDINAYARPAVTVVNANLEYNPINKIFYVNSSPVIDITFSEFINVNNLNISLDSILLQCSAGEDNMEFTCVVPTGTNLINKEYNLIIDVESDEGYNSGYWEDIKIVYDTINPNITEITLPEAIKLNVSRVFKIYLENPEKDALINISIKDMFGNLLDDMSHSIGDDIYAAYLDTNYFNFVANNTYNLTISVLDRAMNKDEVTQLIVVDNVPPEINITEFKSGGVTIQSGGDPLNITTRNSNITIKGNVKELLIDSICIEAESSTPATITLDPECLYVCEQGQTYSDGCIEKSTGEFLFEFRMDFPPDYGSGSEVWNYIQLDAEDVAGNFNRTTLTALMDWKSPEVEEIIFT